MTIANYNYTGTPVITSYGSGFALDGVEALAQGSLGSLRIYNSDDETAVIGTWSTRQLPRVAAATEQRRVLVVGATGFVYENVSSLLYAFLVDGAGNQVGVDVVIGGSTDVATPAVTTLRDGRAVAVWVDRTSNAITGQYLTVTS